MTIACPTTELLLWAGPARMRKRETANQHHSALVSPIMRSTTSGQLNFPRTKTDYGKRRFAINGLVDWTSLPTELRSPDISLGVFKPRLKTVLFYC